MSTPADQPKKKHWLCCNPFQCRCCNFYIPQRFILAILLHLFLQTHYNTRVVLNVAIVEMVPPPLPKNNSVVVCSEYARPEETKEGGKFPWPRKTKSLVLYAFYIGYTLPQLPGGWMADKFGARYIVLGSLFFSITITAAFPIVTQWWGWMAAVVLRTILGLVQGPILPAISSLVSTWVPPNERGLLGGISYSGSTLGTIIGSIFTGMIIKAYNGWPIAFYFWSGYALIYSIFALLWVFSFPDTHPFISEEEVLFIRKSHDGTKAVVKRDLKTPWKDILLNVPYWACICAHFGHNYIYFTMVTYLPTYMREVLQFDVENDGLFSAIPFVALWISTLILTATSKYFLKCMSELTFAKFFGAGTNLLSALLITAAVHVGCHRMFVIGLYILSMISKAFYYVTLTVNINALSKNYGGTLFGLCNCIGSMSGIFGNMLIGFLTKDNNINGWRLSFWITSGIVAFTTVIFFIFGSAERQKFDYEDDELQ